MSALLERLIEASVKESAEKPAAAGEYALIMVRGSGWMVAMRWAVRCIGLVSTIILARLLTPTDFGLVAKAMLVVGMLEILAETGQRLALIRHPQPTRAHYDTAWTIGIIVNAALALGMFFVAPVAGSIFHEPAAVPLVRILALRTLLNGFENIGTVDFRRDMDYGKDFHFNVLTKILSFAVTISLALYFRNYIALIGGIVLGQLILVAVSYGVSSYRPRLSLATAGEIWGYSIWVLISQTGSYALTRLDQWVLSARVSNSLMGQYSVGSELAQLPTSEIITPAARALYPVYCRLWGTSLVEMTRALITNLRFIAMACASTGVGIACVAHDFALVVLGQQWSETSQFIAYIALASALSGFNASAVVVLNITGHVRSAGILAWTRVAIAVPCILLGFKLNGPLGVAQSLLVADIIFTPSMYFQVMKAVPISLGTLIGIVWRPLLASGVMAIALQFHPFAQVASPVFRLLLEIAIGACCFTLTLLALWVAAGRPEGGEKVAIEQLRKMCSRANP